jgi:hypothetical protein
VGIAARETRGGGGFPGRTRRDFHRQHAPGWRIIPVSEQPELHHKVPLPPLRPQLRLAISSPVSTRRAPRYDVSKGVRLLPGSHPAALASSTPPGRIQSPTRSLSTLNSPSCRPPFRVPDYRAPREERTSLQPPKTTLIRRGEGHVAVPRATARKGLARISRAASIAV